MCVDGVPAVWPLTGAKRGAVCRAHGDYKTTTKTLSMGLRRSRAKRALMERAEATAANQQRPRDRAPRLREAWGGCGRANIRDGKEVESVVNSGAAQDVLAAPGVLRRLFRLNRITVYVDG